MSDEHGNDPAASGRRPTTRSIMVTLIGALVILALPRFSCRSTDESVQPQSYARTATVQDGPKLIAAAKELVRGRLRDPRSAEFDGVVFHPAAGQHPNVVCGKVNARNGYGGMTGYERFVVGGTTAIESDVGAVGMDQLWAEFC